MLAALNLRSVVMGVAAGGLTSTLIGLVVGGGLAILNVSWGPEIGLLVGVVSGMLLAGWVAGMTSLHSHRFHGSVSGLLFSGILILVASASSADSSVWSVILLAVVGMVVGGVGGWLGGRRRARAAVK